MKQYIEYMDNVNVSDTLHQRLLNLDPPQKRPAAWKKYGGIAAALVLVCGVGAWGLGHGGWDAIETNFNPLADYISVPEIADTGEPDIAPVDPGAETVDPGMKAGGGYEVTDGEMTAYFCLPYIEFGMAGDMSEMALDWDLPKGSTRRDLTQADFAALFGGEDALSAHLGWGGYELTGWAAWYEDGTLWGAFINGSRGADHFEFAFTTGNVYPPTCIAYGEDGVVNELWDVPVTAWGHDGRDGVSRRVEFLHDGYGFRFDLTGSDRTQADADNLVSRITHWLIVEGVEAQALTSEGAVLAHPWEADPNYSVGEPNWNDGAQDYDSDCPYCADGTVHTHPYNPQEAADPSYNAPMETRSPSPG